MTIRINKVRSAHFEEWDFIWNACKYATYFHSREWAEIWCSYTNGKMRPAPKIVIFSDGKMALLPLSCLSSYGGFIKEYISSPAGSFGGWISSDHLQQPHADLLGAYLLSNYKSLKWRVNPYDGNAKRAARKIAENDETQALSLTEGFTAVYKKWTKGSASAAKKARREGVTVEIASGLEKWQKYYLVYEDSLRRWGKSVSSRYHWNLFEIIYLTKSPNIRLWLANYKNKVIAGALCFYAQEHVVYWHGAALSDYFRLRPVNLLIYECIQDACEQGYSWFDFNPSGGHEGVRAFKKSFGTVALSSPVVKNKGRLHNLLTNTSRFLK
jgi:hypothetical protein